ncbi:MAG: 50S ribosomal protein L35 [Patescibacteria group bacterium]|nr:50S ribosomal protein L35 [Patescibacteria group bacterium]
MGKNKTKKSISKRFKVTKTGKVIKRTNGQGHFNSRETGKVRRNKRSDVTMSPRMQHFVKDNI